MIEHVKCHNKLNSAIHHYVEIHTGKSLQELTDDDGMALMAFLSSEINTLMMDYLEAYYNIKLKYE